MLSRTTLSSAASYQKRRSQQTRHIHPMLDRCWTDVVDGGPTLVQHWVDVSSSLEQVRRVTVRLHERIRVRILVQVTIYRIIRDDPLDQSEACDIS